MSTLVDTFQNAFWTPLSYFLEREGILTRVIAARTYHRPARGALRVCVRIRAIAIVDRQVAGSVSLVSNLSILLRKPS